MGVTYTKKSGSVAQLEITNGDHDKFGTCMERWAFKDQQSLLRFSLSILLLAEEEEIWIKRDGSLEQIKPADDLLKLNAN